MIALTVGRGDRWLVSCVDRWKEQNEGWYSSEIRLMTNDFLSTFFSSLPFLFPSLSLLFDVCFLFTIYFHLSPPRSLSLASFKSPGANLYRLRLRALTNSSHPRPLLALAMRFTLYRNSANQTTRSRQYHYTSGLIEHLSCACFARALQHRDLL